MRNEQNVRLPCVAKCDILNGRWSTYATCIVTELYTRPRPKERNNSKSRPYMKRKLTRRHICSVKVWIKDTFHYMLFSFELSLNQLKSNKNGFVMFESPANINHFSHFLGCPFNPFNSDHIHILQRSINRFTFIHTWIKY